MSGGCPNLVLFEHASGYGLFKVKEFEEIEALNKQVEASLQVRIYYYLRKNGL